ncbi:hypothetical protein MVES_000264 [Malassezia vespertilionis]|uniref:Uncharacterized protein n=1 Tax=Malassezia vespertilionis TaxID=2020962 RepID=A0A2N1JGD1_9BASI|nr:hypothetical protein MVES_000264 [Malassezia vespertilionis]
MRVQSYWSDDESDDDAQRAMVEWVHEVNRFLGGSPRRSSDVIRARHNESPRLSSQTAPVGTASRLQGLHISAPQPMSILCSAPPTRLCSSSGSESIEGGEPATPYPVRFRPYCAAAPQALKRFSLQGPLPPQKLSPVIPLPNRPAATDVPKDIEEDDASLCLATSESPIATSPIFYKSTRARRSVRFVDDPAPPCTVPSLYTRSR